MPRAARRMRAGGPGWASALTKKNGGQEIRTGRINAALRNQPKPGAMRCYQHYPMANFMPYGNIPKILTKNHQLFDRNTPIVTLYY